LTRIFHRLFSKSDKQHCSQKQLSSSTSTFIHPEYKIFMNKIYLKKTPARLD